MCRSARITGAALAVFAVVGGMPARAAPPPDAALTWSVRPSPIAGGPDRPNFGYDAEPGTQLRDSIRIRNYGLRPLVLDLYAADAVVTPTGALDLLPLSAPSTGVGSWIFLDRAQVEVAADDHVDVAFTLVVPPGATAGDYSGGIATAVRTPGTDAAGNALIVERRLANRVNVRVGGELTPALTVSDVEIDYTSSANPLAAGDLAVRYRLTNTGNVRLAAEQSITVPSRLGFAGRRAALSDVGELLPGATLDVDVVVPGVWATVRTQAIVEVEPVDLGAPDVPGGPVVTTTASTWSVPTALVVVLVVLAVAGGAAALRVRSRRRAVAAEAAADDRTAALIEAAVARALAERDSAESGADSDLHDSLS